MKKLGFGLMRLPLTDKNDQTAIDMEELKRMVDLFLSKGFTYFDTAIMYNGFRSQAAAKEALVDRYPRDSFTLSTKMHHEFFNSAEDIEKRFAEQLEQTGAGYFDYYLVHGIEEGNYPKYEKYDCFGWVLRQKEKGLVKHAGLSFHGSPELLDEILNKYPEMEFVQIQLNYLDWKSEWTRSEEVYEVAVKHGKPVIVMEPVKGGTLANLPEEAEKLFRERDPEASAASWAIRFAASQEHVMMVLSGMSNLKQMEDNLSFMDDFKPLTEEEIALTQQAAGIINSQIAVPCTACSYCTDGCPQQIPIPKYFSLYNEDMREDMAEKGWTINFSYYNNLAAEFGRARDCVACGQCESMCPQHIPVIEKLKEVSAHFDRG